MRLVAFVLLTAVTAATAGSSQRQADLSRELAGRTAGEPRDCVAASPGATLSPRDRRTLVYRRGGTIWVNRLRAECPGLEPMSRLLIDMHGSRYCRGDRLQALEQGHSIPGPFCILGSFTPYRR